MAPNLISNFKKSAEAATRSCIMRDGLALVAPN
jgi:hypothetical protein